MKVVWTFVILIVTSAVGGLVYLQIGFPQVSPAPTLAIDSTPKMLERGKYIAHHVALCIDCHSERDYSVYTAPLKPGTEGKGGEVFDETMGFPGRIYARNITPSALRHWTDGEIFRAVTSGVNKEGEPLFPLMPYLNYAQLDPEDIHATIAYIRTLTPIENTPPSTSLDFPMNFIVRTIPSNADMGQRPDTADVVAYGKYLVTMASCSDCHTPAEKGAPLPGMAFAGGMTFKMPWGTLKSANITPDDAHGIGTWTKEQFVRRFKSYADSAVIVPLKPPYDETRFQTIMPWSQYAGMTTHDLGSIYEYLRTLEPVSNKVVRYTAEGATYNK